MIDYGLSTEYCKEVNASQLKTALCGIWPAAGGIAAEPAPQTEIKECEGTAMKKAISLLLVIVMMTIALAGCGSKSENPAGNADSNQPADESITIKNSPDKYTWYIKNYVGKNCASIGYTSMGGDRMDHYGAGYIELVMVTPDGAYIDIETDDDLKQYVVTVQSYAPNTELKYVFDTDEDGNECLPGHLLRYAPRLVSD